MGIHDDFQKYGRDAGQESRTLRLDTLRDMQAALQYMQE